MKKKTKEILTIVVVLIVITAVGLTINYHGSQGKIKYLESAEIQIVDKGEEKAPLNLKDLEALTPMKFNATLQRSVLQSDKEYTFMGFSLEKVLTFADIMPQDEEVLVVVSVEGYEFPFTREEIKQNENVFIVYKEDGNYLRKYKDGRVQGPYMLLVLDDPLSWRWDKYLCRLELRNK